MDDWRLNGQKAYLFRAILFKTPSYELHTHCDFCWAKFSTAPEDLQWGYATADLVHWVCEDCYNDFKDEFEWKVEL